MIFLRILALILVIAVTEGRNLVKRQSSCDYFEYFVERNYNGASGNSDGTTAELCKELCIRSSTCLAVDYNPNSHPKCWVHSNPSVLTATLHFNADTTHFRKDTSCTGPCDMWTKFTDKHQTGGIAFTAGSTLEECKQGCLESVQMCYAIDFDPDSEDKCWLHMDETVRTSPLKDYHEVNHYRRNLGCSEIEVCTNNWTATANSYEPGGIGRATADTLDKCKQACIDYTPKCHGIDFHPSSQYKCWLHTTENPTLESYDGITYYAREEQCIV